MIWMNQPEQSELNEATGPIKILQQKIFTIQFYQAFRLDAKNVDPIKMLEK